MVPSALAEGVPKNSKVNISSIVGEYAEVTLKNNSTAKAELFSLGSEVALSSK